MKMNEEAVRVRIAFYFARQKTFRRRFTQSIADQSTGMTCTGKSALIRVHPR